MKEEFCSCVRCFLLVFNAILMFVGLTVLGFGAYLYLDPEMQAYVRATGNYWILSYCIYGLIGLGGITLIASLVGCCGSYHENSCLLGTYFVLITIAFSLHIAASLIFYLKIELILAHLQSEMVIGQTRVPDGRLQIMDVIEKRFQCCGVHGPSDYDKLNIPLSCCRPDFDCNSLVIRGYYPFGCLETVRSFMQQRIVMLCLISASIAVFE
ncbi:Cd82 molecule, partial [Cichlidogyrus casuarinus]